jgi:hypothetical protein
MLMVTERILKEIYHSEAFDIVMVEIEPGLSLYKLIVHGKTENASPYLQNVILESALTPHEKLQLLEDFDLSNDVK